MKLSCAQKNLEKGLQIVARAAGSRTSLPILNCVLLEVENGKFRISATDLEMGIKTKIGAKIEEDGKITAPAKVLLDFVSGNRDKNIDLKIIEKKLVLKSERYQANINSIDASEFPLIPKIEKGLEISLPTKKLFSALSKTAFAVSLDETRPTLTGVYFNLKGGHLSLAATDSYRLAEKKIKVESEKEASFVVPLKTCQEIMRIASYSSPESEATLNVSENQAAFKIDSTEVISRLLEGEFPDYKGLIPKDFQTQAKLKREEFLDIVKVISFFARETANNIKLKLTGDGEVSISSISSQVGDSKAKMEALVSGEPGEISFNAKFLTDVLATLSDEEVIFEMTGKFSPGVIRSPKDPDFVYIIMPLRTEEEE